MSELTTRRELHGKRLFGYTFGDLGFTLPNMFTGVFLFQYYVYTINLNAIFVAVGVTTQLIIGAISGIIFGVIIDNKSSIWIACMGYNICSYLVPSKLPSG